MQPQPRRGTKGTILIGEAEAEVRNYLEMALRCHGFQVECAEDGDEVLRLLRTASSPFSAILLDIMKPCKDGLEALREIRQFDSELPVIILSSASAPNDVVEAMKSGATDFLAKPVTHECLCNALRKLLNGDWDRTPAPKVAEAATVQSGLFAAGRATKELEALLQKIAPTDVPVLIQGETGVGKEVVARYLHANSTRSAKQFVKLNCAALPSELVESELFGYERGAFTGAFQKKTGMFEAADGGTLFLDEIGDMDFKLQAKLLQVLQDHSFQRVGGRETVHVDVRILAATHCDLAAGITEARFRSDLYYRLNVIPVHVPPLRERKDEIIPLAEFLMTKHSGPRLRMAPLPISADLRAAMLQYHWPGNVRELENTIQRYLILRDPAALAVDLRLQSVCLNGGPNQALTIVAPSKDPTAEKVLVQVRRAKDKAEKDAIIAALEATRWKRKQAAALLGIDYKALLYKVRKLGIDDSVAPRRRRTPRSGGYEPSAEVPEEFELSVATGD